MDINTQQSISVALAFYNTFLAEVAWNLNYIENLHVKNPTFIHPPWAVTRTYRR